MMKKNFAKTLAVILSVSTAVTMSAGTIFADSEYDIAKDDSDGSGLIEEEKDDEDLITEEPAGTVIPETEEPGSGNEQDDIPEWAVDEEGPTETRLFDKYALPSSFDMRDYGWITPVKFQNPWGSCWAFGGIAAAESSLISSGLVPEDYPLDLSERHLTWFAYYPITADEDSTQAGEGMFTTSDDINAAFDAGGFPVSVSSFFASGAGPVEEEYFPYWGAEKLTVDDTMDQCVEDEIQTAANAAGISFDEEVKALEEQLGFTTYEQLYEYIKSIISAYPTYSKFDDWSVPAVGEDGHSNRFRTESVVLKNANIIPDYRSETGEVSEDAIRAMKQEMVDGRAIDITYYADQSGTYVATAAFDATGKYGEGIYGGSMYAQYVDTPLTPDHSVCIVGWDDNFPASNFVPGHQPPADGAWIVKNSWGSEADACEDANGNTVNKKPYGAYNEGGLTTGYFYLSYYDQTIASSALNYVGETFEFSSNIAPGKGFEVAQYDYLPASAGFYSDEKSTRMASANIFTADKDMDMISISTRTVSPNTRVTYTVYLLDEGAVHPDQGTLLYRASVNYEYGGFHRLDLDRELHFNAGDRFSVIATAYKLNDDGSVSYEVSANMALGEETARQYGAKAYAQKVINEGESFIYDLDEASGESVWSDWKEKSAEYEAVYLKEGLQLMIDNFSIKAYCVPSEYEPIDISEPLIKGIEDKPYTGAEITQKFTVSVGGRELSEGTDYVVSYKDNINAGTAAVIITGINGYTGSVTRTFRITPVTLKASDVTLKTASYTYNGKAKSPAVTVKSGSTVLKKGTDYTVKYTNNTNPGTATATVTGKGNYTGTVKKTYEILPKGTEITSVEPGKQQATIQWKKQAVQTTGYNIQYSTKKDFSSGNVSLTVRDNKTVKKTIKSLKSGKTYYIRIRTYKTVSGKNYYSEWSKTKTMKAK